MVLNILGPAFAILLVMKPLPLLYSKYCNCFESKLLDWSLVSPDEPSVLDQVHLLAKRTANAVNK